MWTQFWDMHSGGGTKEEPYNYIYIEAREKVAKVIFYNRFGHNPDRVSCTCCGSDYAIEEFADLGQATAYHRGCRFDKMKDKYVEEVDKEWSGKGYCTLEEYLKHKDVLVIRAKDIKDSERFGKLPTQGYVWVD